MDVAIIETSGLGDRSYLVSDGGVGVVIDPQRDIDRVLDLAREHGVRITHVLETHIHNDYVTGGLELARTTRRRLRRAGRRRGRLRAHTRSAAATSSTPDRCTLQVMHTPGHTHHHVSYVLRDTTGEHDGRVHRRFDAVRHNRTHRPARRRSTPRR